MDIIETETHLINAYEFNNRTHSEEQISRIASSIKEFGFNQPIVIDENNIVLVGHGRLYAAKSLNLDKVPSYKITGLTEVQKKAYRILDNKLQNDSTWQFNNLDLELGFLEDNGLDLEEWGLDSLRDLLDSNTNTEIVEDDGGGELPDETYLKLGDLIELGKHRVLCGDSTSAEDVARLMNGTVARLVYTDPPYGVDYDGGTTKREKLANDHSTVIFHDVMPRIAEAVDVKAPLYLWHADQYVTEVMQALKKEGYSVRSTILWNKNVAQFGALSAQYKRKHELCLYCFKKGQSPYWYGPTNETTVWDVDRASKNEFHPTQKPIELAARALKNSSQKNDLVLDVFLGSGSTLLAADQLNRTCYGMELEPKYCQVILERYQKHCIATNKEFICKINGEVFNGTQTA